MPCYTCGSPTIDLQEHHIVQRSRGGINLSTVNICASCHQVVHSAAKKAIRGKSYWQHLSHLDDESKRRVDFLVKAIVAVELDDRANPNPMIVAVLEDKRYLDGLKLMQRDLGFSSRDKLLNAIFKDIAKKYGMFDDSERESKLVTLESMKDLKNQ